VIFFDGRGGPPRTGGGKRTNFMIPWEKYCQPEIQLIGDRRSVQISAPSMLQFNIEQLITQAFQTSVFNSIANVGKG
jgi:hypothetical protein